MQQFAPKLSRWTVETRPVLTFGKDGSLLFLGSSPAVTGLEAGSGIGFFYDSDSQTVYLTADPKSPVKLCRKSKSSVKRQYYIGLKNKSLCERIKTYLRVTHDHAFRTLVHERALVHGKLAYKLELL